MCHYLGCPYCERLQFYMKLSHSIRIFLFDGFNFNFIICSSTPVIHENIVTVTKGLRNCVDRSDSFNRSLVSDRSKVVIFNLRALHSLSKLTSATIQINNNFRVTRMTVKTSVVKIARMNEFSYL